MTWALAFAVVWGAVVAGFGAVLTDISLWYLALRRPRWQPPDWAFGPAWTLILALSSIAAWFGLEAAQTPAQRIVIVGLFLLNGVLNLVWSPLFFRLQRPDLALVEVPFLWLSILALVVVLAPLSLIASLLVLPYLAWVTFAAVLNRAIVRLNGPFVGVGPARQSAPRKRALA